MKDDPRAEYEKFARDNPGISYTRWFWDGQLAKANAGTEHASIGRKIEGDLNWIDSAKKRFTAYKKSVDLEPRFRVIDYGCGTLRVGVHFINFLDKGNYWGMEPSPGMTEVGAELVGQELMAAKTPVLSGISENDIERAADWGADFVFSVNVAFHIPPSEIERYLANLVRLTAKKGAILSLQARFSPEVRSGESESPMGSVVMWSYPVEFFIQNLKPLVITKLATNPDKLHNYGRSGTMEFVRVT
jgi:SAM-dependent methyltransferase